MQAARIEGAARCGQRAEDDAAGGPGGGGGFFGAATRHALGGSMSMKNLAAAAVAVAAEAARRAPGASPSDQRASRRLEAMAAAAEQELIAGVRPYPPRCSACAGHQQHHPYPSPSTRPASAGAALSAARAASGGGGDGTTARVPPGSVSVDTPASAGVVAGHATEEEDDATTAGACPAFLITAANQETAMAGMAGSAAAAIRAAATATPRATSAGGGVTVRHNARPLSASAGPLSASTPQLIRPRGGAAEAEDLANAAAKERARVAANAKAAAAGGAVLSEAQMGHPESLTEEEASHRRSELSRLRAVRAALRLASTASLIHKSVAKLDELDATEQVARRERSRDAEQQRAAARERADARVAAARSAQRRSQPHVVVGTPAPTRDGDGGGGASDADAAHLRSLLETLASAEHAAEAREGLKGHAPLRQAQTSPPQKRPSAAVCVEPGVTGTAVVAIGSRPSATATVFQ